VIDPTPRGARRAALVLHALQPGDRRWLMARLDAADRQRLQLLIDELDALGIDVETTDVAALTAAPSPSSAPPLEPDWPARLPDEPAWVRDLLQGGAFTLAPAARRALQQAASLRPGPRSPAQPMAHPARPAAAAVSPTLEDRADG
jgi:hypothetical protein